LASYLGVSPETLNRIIKKSRELEPAGRLILQFRDKFF
jgi:hypothetical protein